MGKTEFKRPSGRRWTSKIINKTFNDCDLQQKTTKTEKGRLKSPSKVILGFHQFDVKKSYVVLQTLSMVIEAT